MVGSPRTDARHRQGRTCESRQDLREKLVALQKRHPDAPDFDHVPIV